jgi:hypothetical protein
MPEHTSTPLVFNCVRVDQSLVLYVNYCSFLLIIVCSFVPLLLFATVLSVFIPFVAAYYFFDIFNLSLHITNQMANHQG